MIPPLHILAARLAEAGYEEREPYLRGALAALGAVYHGRIMTNECKAALATLTEGGYERRLVIFSGTHFSKDTSPEEIIDNLDFEPVQADPNNPDIKAARGYWEPLMSELPQILGFLSMDAPVICIGHSEGGIRANLASAELSNRGYAAQAISFGAPKGANRAYWLDRPGACYRYVNQRDPVPDWPFSFFSDLAHPTPMEWLHNGGLIANGDFVRPGISACLDDHWIENYIAKMAAFGALV